MWCVCGKCGVMKCVYEACVCVWCGLVRYVGGAGVVCEICVCLCACVCVCVRCGM